MPLVNKYCHFIYQNEDLTDNVKQQLAMILRRVQLDLRHKNAVILVISNSNSNVLDQQSVIGLPVDGLGLLTLLRLIVRLLELLVR